MKEIYADTLYWVALVRPGDPWQAASRDATARLESIRLVTTEEVLTEFLNVLSGAPYLRQRAARAARRIMSDPGITVIAQSEASFQAGLALYEQRADKAYSLTDCISMQALRARAIHQVLTNDHHFTQEGFQILITQDDS